VWVTALLGGGWAEAIWAEGAETAASPKRPNVVVFLADDAGWGDFRCLGNSNATTPHVDSLARDGAKVEWFYVCPVCSPTRAEFLTGRYHARCGVRGVSTGQERLNLDERTIADAFRAAGYATGCFGKWHNGSQWPYHPNARGFDEYYGFTSGHWGEYFDAPLEHNGEPVRGRGFVADDFASRANAFIEARRDQPFFCYVAFNTPHSPWAVPEEYWSRYRDKPLELKAEPPHSGPTGGKTKANDTENLDETRCALAMVENLDANVGRVLRKLEELDLDRNTIVLFFSDNGPNTWRWNGGMKGRKGTVDEGGVRSPCFVRWTGGGIRPGTEVREIAGAIDLLPTLCSLAGVRPVGEKPLDGRDLSPLLKGETLSDDVAREWKDRRVFTAFGTNVSVRTASHRYDARGGLFDLRRDLGQTEDIAREQPELAKQLADEVARWKVETGAGIVPPPEARPFPVGYREFPRTPLPARDGVAHGVAHGGIRRSAPAPNCSYFVNWTRLDDRITWDVDVHTAGEYDVEVLYTCPEADAGSTFRLSLGEAKLEGRVEPGWDPPQYANQDTLPRPPAESKMKEFRTLRPGTIRLAAGRGLLTLSAVEIPGKSVMDVRQVNLVLRVDK
jgi:arylsulfatase A-like enzyme